MQLCCAQRAHTLCIRQIYIKINFLNDLSPITTTSMKYKLKLRKRVDLYYLIASKCVLDGDGITVFFIQKYLITGSQTNLNVYDHLDVSFREIYFRKETIAF